MVFKHKGETTGNNEFPIVIIQWRRDHSYSIHTSKDHAEIYNKVKLYKKVQYYKISSKYCFPTDLPIGQTLFKNVLIEQ